MDFGLGDEGCPGKCPGEYCWKVTSDQNNYLLILSELLARALEKLKQRYLVSQVQDQLTLQDKQIQARIIIACE